MPTNLYGPNDNYHLQNAHVLPALLRKMHEAQKQGLPQIEVWGSGHPMREFLHVDDLADACVFLMRTYNGADWLNVGTGTDITIRDLALLIKEIIGYDGQLVFDASKPDGTPRKLLDVSRLHRLGWKHRIPLEEGLRRVYAEVSVNGFD
jgi:GDP-L-fucose synthase